MNLTEKARKGSCEAMEELFDSTKTDVMYLSTLLLGSDKVASTAVPRIYRSLWEQLLAGRLTSEEEFTQAAILKTVTFCKTLLGKKDPKIFRIPSNRDFVQGIGENVSVKGEAWEVVLNNLPPLHRFLYLLTALCEYTPAQLAKLFHTNEETVRMALEAESTNLNRIMASASRKTGREYSVTVQEFHRALETKRARAEVPPAVDQSVLNTVNALCEPIQRKIKRKRKRVAAIVGVAAVAACLVCGTAFAALSGSEGEAQDAEVSSPLGVSSEVGEESEAETEETSVDVTATAYADIEIQDYGTITVALDGNSAPETVENFISLAESGFYDGLTFHRIIESFMMQGGDPNGDGTGGSDETIPGEFTENGYDNELSHTRGAVSMARSDDYDSASSQFFIVQEDSTYLDGEYAVFGYVTEGMDIVDEICESAQPTDDNGTIPAEEQPVISSITIRYEE